MEKATFAGGCFWCTEAIFERVEGVLEVLSGYTGGTGSNPSYKEISTGKTGHAEAVQISYDASQVSYLELLEIFFKTHDPTTLNRQGADVGTQYRSAIFFHDDKQLEQAKHTLETLDAEGIWDDPIVTTLERYERFWKAEGYHQEYYENNPGQGYCRVVITPKIEKFEKTFSEKLKK